MADHINKEKIKLSDGIKALITLIKYRFKINMSSDIKIGSNRSFGVVFFIFFLFIALYPLINDGEVRLWSLVISLIFLVLGYSNQKF